MSPFVARDFYPHQQGVRLVSNNVNEVLCRGICHCVVEEVFDDAPRHINEMFKYF